MSGSPTTKERYAKSTAVQPKNVTEGHKADTVFRNAEQDIVNSAFGQGAYQGIRSLPNALSPDFRSKLFKEVIEETKRTCYTEAGTGSGGRPDMRKGDLSVEVANGQRKPGVRSAAPTVFSHYEHKHTEYAREKEMKAAEQRESKTKWLGAEDFKVTALPPIPKSVGAFNEFEYTIDPYETMDQATEEERRMQSAKIQFGPMKAGGRVQAAEQMKIRIEEVMTQMAEVLRSDWPKSFLRVFEDIQGLLVACFDKAKMGEGDVTAYMNQFFRTNAIVKEFQLHRDTTRWGVMEETVPNVYYLFIPPWVHARVIHPELSKVPDCKPVPGIQEPPLATGRVPFPPTTKGGIPMLNTYVQTYPRSFKI
mmetsp:Transcript_24486/g.33756  ORF Transcript_24486/g.33756 Transcript_24486/m.33756 type:complete len:364 (+) Transcript_24486:48-1139(+)|eukprot:CAMPEP_0196582180 /NCGR_PEP_ID=MMETSP1081-20130531/37878_1 /TAXON_ID=36882 /ORGANISM="Pyramimonas amylifera, Strain CCMP720" /LENGTH=363 /DNA_ID=CAMNT_0041902675 /DNA_START=43 /DNA_END=1134 /DNA_ORIENTATION=-